MVRLKPYYTYVAHSGRLGPHEDQWTDVVLLGHSMGGLLAADVTVAFRHRIIGVINFDVPFLGMHPGIVKAGLGSLFSKPPPPQDAIVQEEQPEKRPSRMGTIFNPKPTDPNYNPSFHNDVQLPVRKGWQNALHWMNKHYSEGLTQATKTLVKSHFEFGGAMADYRELKDRYAKVRALEEDDVGRRKAANPGFASPPRIRFVNYYTVSTGRPKKPKSPESPATLSHKPPSPTQSASEGVQSRDSDVVSLESMSQPEMTHIHPEPMAPSPRVSMDAQNHGGDSAQDPMSQIASTPSRTNTTPPELPEIPLIPQEPPFVDLMQYTDKTQRKAAEKEHDHALKEYQKAVKARNKAINERTKIEEKWEKQQQEKAKQDAQLPRNKHPERQASSSQDTQDLEEDLGAMELGDTQHHNNHPYAFSHNTILDQTPPSNSSTTLATTSSNATTSSPSGETFKPKKPKLGKFCMLPPKDSLGNTDPTWVKVVMEGVDEVTAHTSLFFVNETYERLVGDVGARIEEWVREADSERVVREMQGL
jgi:pimeloyl-ACP methyl ester carboxylesterase